jgi:hypothetical protein
MRVGGVDRKVTSERCLDGDLIRTLALVLPQSHHNYKYMDIHGGVRLGGSWTLGASGQQRDPNTTTNFIRVGRLTRRRSRTARC